MHIACACIVTAVCAPRLLKVSPRMTCRTALWLNAKGAKHHGL
jgi:hypothetical protein